MPTLNIPKPDPKLWYVCIEPHVSDAFGAHHPGDRLRGDHPAVKFAPLWWVEETLDTEERHAARQARLRLAYPMIEDQS